MVFLSENKLKICFLSKKLGLQFFSITGDYQKNTLADDTLFTRMNDVSFVKKKKTVKWITFEFLFFIFSQMCLDVFIF